MNLKIINQISETFSISEKDLKQIKKLNELLREKEKSLGADPFGLDLKVLSITYKIVYFFYRHYFRVECSGVNNIPDSPAIFIANHGGQLPIDALMVTSALALEKDPPRLVRSMVEKWVPTLPFISELFQSLGQPTGTKENFDLLAKRAESFLIFPEGVKGISKPFTRRYRVREFPPGFVKLAKKHNLPIIPVAIIGSEEQYPSIGSIAALAKFLKAPAFPVTPFFPWLGPLGLLPLPTKYRLIFGQPFWVQENDLAENVAPLLRERLQGMIHRGLAKRENIFW